MDDRVDRLLREALGLSPADRTRIVAALLAALEADVPARQGGEEDWIREIERRARAAFAGNRGVSWSEACAPIQDRLSKP
jgi:hypothetical protein